MSRLMGHDEYERAKADPLIFKFMKFCVQCNKGEDDDGDESKYTPHVSEDVIEDWMDASIPDEDLSDTDLTARFNDEGEFIERCTVCGYEERCL